MLTLQSKTETQSKRLRVLIVDDHTLLCESLVAILEPQEGFEMATANSIESASAIIADQGAFDAVLLDYDIPGVEGLNGLRILIEANGGKVALLSGVASWPTIERALEAGAQGFIPKTLAVAALGHAIRYVASGELFLPGDLMLRVSRAQDEVHGLKPREMRVLGLLCEGLPNKDIGRVLSLEETTVKVDVKSICRKLGAQNRTQAVLEAIKRGIY